MTSSCRSDSDGFGLLGVILLILAVALGSTAIFVMVAPSIANRANQETTEKAKTLRAAIQAFSKDHLTAAVAYPPTLDALVTTDGLPCGADNVKTSPTYLTLQGWCGPYLDQPILQNANDFKTDGWGTLFVFNNTTGVLTSWGPNRVDDSGGGDDLVFNP